MGVHHHAHVDAEGVSEDDVGGLSSDSGEGREILHPPRHLAAVTLQKGATAGLDVLRLVPVEADPTDVGLQDQGIRRRVVGGAPVLPEQVCGDDVHLLVGTLCRQDGGHQEFQRRGEGQLAVGVGIGGLEDLQDPLGPLLAGGFAFPWHPGSLDANRSDATHLVPHRGRAFRAPRTSDLGFVPNAPTL